MLLLTGVALLLFPVGAPASTQTNTPLLQAINAARLAHGLKPVRIGGRLETAAQAHTRAMLATQVFEHGPFVSRLRDDFHVTAPAIGEILAWGTGSKATAGAIVAAWLASPPHRRNLLDPTFSLIGIGDRDGVFHGQADARVVTVDFAGG
jgi:uncharacterized protein YkwD